MSRHDFTTEGLSLDGHPAVQAQEEAETEWEVREATSGDVSGVATAVEELLLELGGKPPAAESLCDAAQTVLDNPEAGVLLVADLEGEIIGFLGASWATAVRIPGRYGTIEELWVHRDWRSREVGRELVEALCELAEEEGLKRIEVGLPSPHFDGLASTEAFYRSNGFQGIGLRMKRLLG